MGNRAGMKRLSKTDVEFLKTSLFSWSQYKGVLHSCLQEICWQEHKDRLYRVLLAIDVDQKNVEVLIASGSSEKKLDWTFTWPLGDHYWAFENTNTFNTEIQCSLAPLPPRPLKCKILSGVWSSKESISVCHWDQSMSESGKEMWYIQDDGNRSRRCEHREQ